MAKHRILHVLGTAQAEGTAINQIVERLAASLNPQKYEIQACFLRSGEFTDRFRARGITSTCVNWSGTASDPLGAARYLKHLHSSKFDLIHQHTGGRILTQIGRTRSGALIVRHVHGRALEETGAILSTIRLPGRDVTVANSKIVAEACNDQNAIVIYPGIDPSEFHPDRSSRRHAVIGTASRLVPVKGISTLIEAVALLAPNYPSIRLEIAGNGYLRSELEQYASGLGISDKVHFLGWCKDLPAILPTWDVFVQPSLDEGFGVSVLEAMASGLPVVASDVGGLRELVLNNQTGFLVPSEAPAEFAAKIAFLVETPEAGERMGAAGRHRAEDRFSAAEMVRRTSDLYDSLLASRALEA